MQDLNLNLVFRKSAAQENTKIGVDFASTPKQKNKNSQ